MSEALLDSNVVIAILGLTHDDHASSLPLLGSGHRFAIASHSFAEVYNTLTRPAPRGPFQLRPDEAMMAIDSVLARSETLGLTVAQTMDGIRRYAWTGGIGGRLYDALIGEVARVHRIPIIITWNTRHMTGLFRELRVLTPTQYLRLP